MLRTLTQLSSRDAMRFRARLTRGLVVMVVALTLLSSPPLVGTVGAVAPGNEHFERTWARTDKPVAEGQVDRTWMWGPEANTSLLQEGYAESPGGSRTVQYFDKSRMEITHPDRDSNSIWYVTNGLLVVELITGRMQVGDDAFEQRPPAVFNVAGDADDPTGPTYASFGVVLNAAPVGIDTTITKRIDRDGNVSDDALLAERGITTGYLDEITNHSVATPFWDFINSSGFVWENDTYIEDSLFENAFFATGRPISEAYWANVKVAGIHRDVLMQCFERRCLTYTPDNPEGWQVEAGNVGQHYYTWRYGNHTPDPIPSPTPDPATEYEILRNWGENRVDVTIDNPGHVAAAPSGEIYVAVPARHAILKFAPDGVLLAAWSAGGEPGSGQGEFSSPTGVAVDNDGYVYVTDYGNHRIQKFDADGAFVTAWGGLGAGESNFDGPYGITVGRNPNEVYVTELGNHRVQVFTTSGEFLKSWGGLGSGPAQFDSPHGITATPHADVIYVADTGNSRIQMFDAFGTYLGSIGSAGSNGGQLLLPVDVEVFRNGDILVTELGNDRVQAFTLASVEQLNYEHLGYWGVTGSGPGEFEDPKGIASDPDGNVYIADGGNNRIQKFDSAGAYRDLWIDGNRGRFDLPLNVEVNRDGRVFVVDPSLNTVQAFSPDGAYLDRWGPEIPGTTPLDKPWDIAFDVSGNGYVVDRGRIVKLSPDGAYIGQFGAPGADDRSYGLFTSIAVDAAGNIYVADSENKRLRKFAPDFTLTADWQSISGEPDFGPRGIVIHGHEMFILESANNRIVATDLDGAFLREWDSGGNEPDQITGRISRLAIDSDGYVYGAEASMIHKFAPDGTLLATFGSRGTGDGQFTNIWGLAVSPEFHVYASETGAPAPEGTWEYARIQAFAPVD